MGVGNYHSEGKYRCNHPESDFTGESTNPIQMRGEHFVEYTHRNETENLQYDVWEQSNRNPYLNPNMVNTIKRNSKPGNIAASKTIMTIVVFFAIMFSVFALSFLASIFEYGY